MLNKILVINGPNLEILGKREINIYGNSTLVEINSNLKFISDKENADIVFYQSNIEGELINIINSKAKNFDALIINPAAYTHTSLALYDSLNNLSILKIEVHISNIYKREEFRHKSLISDIATGGIFGLGGNGYILAIISMQNILKK